MTKKGWPHRHSAIEIAGYTHKIYRRRLGYESMAIERCLGICGFNGQTSKLRGMIHLGNCLIAKENLWR